MPEGHGKESLIAARNRLPGAEGDGEHDVVRREKNEQLAGLVDRTNQRSTGTEAHLEGRHCRCQKTNLAHCRGACSEHHIFDKEETSRDRMRYAGCWEFS